MRFGTTTGERYGPAMGITTQAEADLYFDGLVRDAMKKGVATRAEAEDIERQNLGYYAGYYTREVQRRVNRLFRTVHPIFGNTEPTPEQAFALGQQLGEATRRGEKIPVQRPTTTNPRPPRIILDEDS